MSSQIFRFPAQTSAMDKFLSVLAEGDKEWTITITRYFKKRSLSQNAMLWGVIYPQAVAFIGGDVNKDDIHEAMGDLFLPTKPNPITSKEYPVSTTSLDTAGMSKYIEDICRFWAQEHGLYIETGSGQKLPVRDQEPEREKQGVGTAGTVDRGVARTGPSGPVV